MAHDFAEPGRHVSDSGLIVYAWPPEGRFAALWERIDAAIPDDEKDDAIALLHRWRDENATLVAFTDDEGAWVDVEPDWDEPKRWLR